MIDFTRCANFRRTLATVSLLAAVTAGSIVGCGGSSGGGSAPSAMTESDFGDPSAVADGDGGIVVDFLEPANSATPDGDTGTVGVDVIPYEYTDRVTNRFCWEDDDPAAEHSAALIDVDGAEILRVQANGDCMTAVVEPGEYTLRIVHDGKSTETLPVFVEATDGATTAGANIVLAGGAPTPGVAEQLDTFLRTKNCRGCTLNDVDLTGAILDGANLSNAHLERAILNGANLHLATLEGTSFVNAKFIDANLSQAVLFQVSLDGADLTGANLTQAHIEQVDFVRATLVGTNLTGLTIFEHGNFTEATLTSLNLTGLDLRTAVFCRAVFNSVDFTGSDLSGAVWTTCKRCQPGSIGRCILQ